jgi:hypothetical protein
MGGHIGLAEEAQLDWLEIRWPDGEVSVVEDLNAGTLVGITREGSQRQSQGRPLPKGSNDQV